MKVYAMPPHAITQSDCLIRFSITRILSLILAPPTMAVSGRSTLSPITWLNASSSLLTRSPATHGIRPFIPTIDACARCAVPNASLTYTSPSFDSDSRKATTCSSVGLNAVPSAFTPLPSSSAWKRRFSRTMMEPSAGLAHAASVSAPTHDGRNVTGLLRSSPRRSATGFRVIFSFGLPSGRPKCDIRMTALAPPSSALLIVGIAPTMR
mmetsp:Transcript_9355/g.18722  ORF Transcript_9355/g.18722 Transcript_9355/m.18722 type:complete len:209 (+) Transcript_9355:587-1213(+)